MKNVHEVLLNQGFQELCLKENGVYGFLKERVDANYCVIFINLPSDLPDNPWAIRYGEQIIKDNSALEGNAHFLFIYITEEPEKLKCLCEDNTDGHWIVNTATEQLIIYENQVSNFCGVRDAIDSALLQRDKTRKYIPFCTIGIMALNVLIFLFIYLICNTKQAELLLDAGGMYWPSVIKGKEYYRFITSIFLHFGTEHLFNNMLCLFIIGMYVEENIGHTKFVFLYFVSGILAGVVSMGYNMIQNKLILCAGASGAIFGVIGALTCLVLFSKQVRRDITAPRLIIFLLLSVFSGFQEQGVDNMAHIGGLMSGFLCMLIIMLIDNMKKNSDRERA